MSNGHLPAGSPAMPGGGHGAHGAQPAYNMGGSPVPNGGRALYPSQYPQSRGRGRTQQYSHPAQPQNFYTQQQVQAQAQTAQFSPHMYGSYPQQGYNGMYGYPNQQPYVGYHYGQNGVMPGPYGHPQHQQHYYGQQHMPMQSWYPGGSIPHYQLPQSPSINTPYPPPPPMAAVQSPDVVPIPPVVPPPQPTPPAFNPAPQAASQAAPVPAAPIPTETPVNQSPSSAQPDNGEAAPDPYYFYPQPSEHALPPAEPEQEAPKPSYQAVPSNTDAQVTSQPTSPVYSPIEPQPGRTWHQIPWSTHPLNDWPKRSKPRRKKKAPQALTTDKPQVPQSGTFAGSGTVEAVEGRASSEKPAVVDERDDSSFAETTSSALNVATDASMTSTPEPTAQRSPLQKTSSVLASTQPPKTTTRSAVPALPVLPALPKDGAVDRSKATAGHEETDKQDDKPKSHNEATEEPKQQEKPAAPAAPKSWAAIAKGRSVSKPAAGQPELNGTATAENASSEIIGTAATVKSSSASLAEALKSFEAGNSGPIHFIEPSGLKNTGTDCYMNSVLQLLLFCTPFYNFLDQVRKNVVHSFKSSSKTPLIDAMIGFISDFRSINAADTPDQLQRKLRPEDHHLLGKAFAPNGVYKVVRELDRFNTVKPGSQHDAPEFLMLLLNGIEEECERMIRDSATFASGSDQALFDHHDTNGGADASDDWTEVGQRQRLAVSQRSGPATIPNPISKIFSGQHREVLRLSRKESVTYNAYQNLSLAIDDPSIKTVIDALKYFHRSEPITSKNSQGIEVNGTKQTLIETLPPILIMHLKRFYVNGGEAEKTWKVVRYPLEFEMPQEILSRQTRNRLLAGGRDLPRYKLTGVVYHHGASVTSGHYTVDALRQDGQEWLRFDDTMITRISGDAVAEAGVEEANQKAAAATKHERVNDSSSNRFAAMGDDNVGDNDGDWKQVGPGANGAKKHSSGVNGSSSGTSTPKSKPIRDHKDHNKVAYLLFYQLWN